MHTLHLQTDWAETAEKWKIASDKHIDTNIETIMTKVKTWPHKAHPILCLQSTCTLYTKY